MIAEAPESAPAHPSATVLLLRDGADGLEVLMVLRHPDLEVAGGARVFPGGRVDAADHALARAFARYAPAGPADDSLPLRIAAIRETYEECAILLARSRNGGPLVGAAPPSGEFGAEVFGPFVESAGLVLATDVLIPYAHWITPLGYPKRFDTWFFVAEAPPDQGARHDGRELVNSIWVSPAVALAEARMGRCLMQFPTRLNLEKMSACTTVAEAIAVARATTVVTVLPEMLAASPGRPRMMRIPREAGYGGEIFPGS